MRCAVGSANDDSKARDVDASLLRELTGLVGIDLSDERASALVAQAVPHLAMLRQLDAIADPATEPAAEFRLDRWTRSSHE
jgi:hypothetical protein